MRLENVPLQRIAVPVVQGDLIGIFPGEDIHIEPDPVAVGDPHREIVLLVKGRISGAALLILPIRPS